MNVKKLMETVIKWPEASLTDFGRAIVWVRDGKPWPPPYSVTEEQKGYLVQVLIYTKVRNDA